MAIIPHESFYDRQHSTISERYLDIRYKDLIMRKQVLLIWWNLQFWWNRIRNQNPQKIAQWYLFKVNRLWTNQSINQSIKHLMFDTDIEERGLKRKGRAAAAASLNPSEFSSTILCFFNSSRSSCGCWDCAPSSTAADVLSLVLHLSQLQLISWTAFKHFGNFSKESKVFKHQ